MLSLTTFTIMRIVTIFIDNGMTVVYNLLLRTNTNKEDK